MATNTPTKRNASVYADSLTVTGNITAPSYNNSNWDTAYGWGNHASQGYATQTYVNSAVADLVDSAPGTLDTLNELAAALGDDPNFASTVSSNIGAKVSKSGDTMTGTLTVPNLTIGSGNRIKFANNDFIRYDDANGVGRFHFDCDGGTNNASVQAATFVGALSGNASTSSRWATARTNTVTLTGDATGSGSASVDGSGNWTVTVNTTVANDSHNHDGRYIPKGGSWFGDLGSYAYVRYNGFQSAGGEFVLVTKNGQISTLIDGAYLSYESANGFFGSYNSQYGNLSGIQATGANTVTVKQLDGGSANLTITGNLTVNGSIAQADGFGTLYTFNTTQGLSTSWADVTAIAGNALPTGTYAIQIFINNSDVGGNSYSEYYSGTMSWYGSGTNDNDWNEIPLHNAGHAQNGPLVYARTLRRSQSTMILQLAASGTIASDAIQIKLRRLI